MTSLLIPLYFVRSGHIAQDNGRLRTADLHGYYWARTVSANDGSTHPYRLRIIVNSVEASGGVTESWYGFPLRGLESDFYC